MKHKRFLSHTAVLLAVLILLPGLASCLHIQKIGDGPETGGAVGLPETEPPETDAPEPDPPPTLPPEPDPVEPDPVETAANFTLEELTEQK